MDPWREIERMRRDMDSLLNGRTYGVGASSSFPLVNVYEDKDTITVAAEIPGLRKEDVSVTLVDGNLTIKGKREQAKLGDNAVILRQERSEGAFEKSLRIPVKVNDAKIAATFKEGMLTIMLPKAEEARPKTITITG